MLNFIPHTLLCEQFIWLLHGNYKRDNNRIKPFNLHTKKINKWSNTIIISLRALLHAQFIKIMLFLWIFVLRSSDFFCIHTSLTYNDYFFEKKSLLNQSIPKTTTIFIEFIVGCCFSMKSGRRRWLQCVNINYLMWSPFHPLLAQNLWPRKWCACARWNLVVWLFKRVWLTIPFFYILFFDSVVYIGRSQNHMREHKMRKSVQLI